MAKIKVPSKAEASKAAKTLNNDRASSKEKSAAGKALAQRSVAVRTVQAAPKTGKVSPSNVKRAVTSVMSRKK